MFCSFLVKKNTKRIIPESTHQSSYKKRGHFKMLRLFCLAFFMFLYFKRYVVSFPVHFQLNFLPTLSQALLFYPPRWCMYLLWDPAVLPRGAALLVEESIEVYCLYAAAAPVLVPEQNKSDRLEQIFIYG